MEKEKQYCVVAQIRGKVERIDLTGPMSKERAENINNNYCNDRNMKKYYRYFKVAKFPYKDKRNYGKRI